MGHQRGGGCTEGSHQSQQEPKRVPGGSAEGAGAQESTRGIRDALRHVHRPDRTAPRIPQTTDGTDQDGAAMPTPTKTPEDLAGILEDAPKPNHQPGDASLPTPPRTPAVLCADRRAEQGAIYQWNHRTSESSRGHPRTPGHPTHRLTRGPIAPAREARQGMAHHDLNARSRTGRPGDAHRRPRPSGLVLGSGHPRCSRRQTSQRNQSSTGLPCVGAHGRPQVPSPQHERPYKAWHITEPPTAQRKPQSQSPRLRNGRDAARAMPRASSTTSCHAKPLLRSPGRRQRQPGSQGLQGLEPGGQVQRQVHRDAEGRDHPHHLDRAAPNPRAWTPTGYRAWGERTEDRVAHPAHEHGGALTHRARHTEGDDPSRMVEHEAYVASTT
ncbi:unnamed protein product, partial [Prorocentrum cordatum]